MYTVNDINNTILINKSKFITYLYSVNNIEDINELIGCVK